MKQDKHILVMTDDETSRVIRILLRQKVIPITRTSIASAMDLLKHLSINAIVIDQEPCHVDSIEFILNARDIAGDVPVFVPEDYLQKEDRHIIRNLGNIIMYNQNNLLLEQEINKLLTTGDK